MLDAILGRVVQQLARRSQASQLAALQTLTTGLAHEVRNPLNAAKLQLELLERRLRRRGADAELTEPVALAHLEIARLTAMLNDFLLFARPPELHVGDHDVVAIARHVIELEPPGGAALELTAPSVGTVAAVDAAKVHQILQHLVRNAREAAPAGGRVTIAIELSDTTLHLRVADNGPGIGADVRARLYEPFFTTKDGGTGMGMAIVASFVAMHGGEIEISTGTWGTCIHVTIPRRSAA